MMSEVGLKWIKNGRKANMITEQILLKLQTQIRERENL